MGYRSQVTLALQPKAAALFSTLRARGGHLAELIEDADTGSHNDGVESYDWDGIKWYDSYPDVQAIEKFVAEAECDEYEFEDDDGKQGLSSEHVRFVRVGEEDGDIETRGSGFWDIYPSTHICY